MDRLKVIHPRTKEQKEFWFSIKLDPDKWGEPLTREKDPYFKIKSINLEYQ